MKKVIFILCFISIFKLGAMAQLASPFKVSIGVDAALPTEGFNANYKGGFGGTLRLSKGVSQHIDVTLTSGTLVFFPKNFIGAKVDNSIFIPLKGGARISISPKLYVIGEVGVTFLKTYGVVSTSAGNTTFGNVNRTYFTYAPGFGFRSKPIDIGLRFENLNGSGFIALRAAYEF